MVDSMKTRLRFYCVDHFKLQVPPLREWFSRASSINHGISLYSFCNQYITHFCLPRVQRLVKNSMPLDATTLFSAGGRQRFRWSQTLWWSPSFSMNSITVIVVVFLPCTQDRWSLIADRWSLYKRSAFAEDARAGNNARSSNPIERNRNFQTKWLIRLVNECDRRMLTPKTDCK